MPSHRILYCVLNWGLGHATRSIPVIHALIARGHRVDIASDGGPLAFLQKTFPDLVSHTLPAYNILYPTRSVLLNAISQMHKMLRAVGAEQRAIRKMIQREHYDAIISDNRYGCYSESIPSVLITHQLSNLAESSAMSKPGELIVSNYLKHFDQVWVPDFPDRQLTGKMTMSASDKIRFVGYISDQRKKESNIEFDVAAILSGPEPQRTKLEEEIFPQLQKYPGRCALARGVISELPVQTQNNVTIYPYLDRQGVNHILNSVKVVVCRTGYSSLMDLMQTGTRAILIPTPGQPEQVYLGEQLRDHPQFVVQKQGEVDIDKGVRTLVKRKKQETTMRPQNLLEVVIGEFEKTIGAAQG